MMMEVEVPGTVTISVATVSDSDVVPAKARKRHPQGEADAVVDEKIVAPDR